MSHSGRCPSNCLDFWNKIRKATINRAQDASKLEAAGWACKALADLLTMCALNVQAPTKSQFCTSLLVQPPAGAWDVQLAAPRVCWAIPSGPEPATRPELRAAKVLWIVGIGPCPGTQGELPLCRRASCCSSPAVARWIRDQECLQPTCL